MLKCEPGSILRISAGAKKLCSGEGKGDPGPTGKSMSSLGRLLITLGIAFIILGILLSYTSFFSFLRLGRLPGDIAIKRENFSFYFPITTCILLSLVVTLVLYLLKK
jgi:hypothetical protein